MRVTFAVGRMIGTSSEIVVATPKEGRRPSTASPGRLVSRAPAPMPSPETVH